MSVRASRLGPVDRLERRPGSVGSSLERCQAGAGLDHDHADMVGHDVVQLARDPLAFVLDGATGPLVAFGLLQTGVLLERGVVAAARSRPVAEGPDDPDSQRGLDQACNDAVRPSFAKITAPKAAAVTIAATSDSRRS